MYMYAFHKRPLRIYTRNFVHHFGSAVYYVNVNAVTIVFKKRTLSGVFGNDLTSFSLAHFETIREWIKNVNNSKVK